MDDLLNPIARFLHGQLDPNGWAHAAMREIIGLLLKYVNFYADYVVFAVVAVPLFFLIPKRLRPHYLLAASVTMIAVLWGAVYTAVLVGVVLLVHLLVGRLRAKALADAHFRKRAIGWLVSGVLWVYGLLLLREGIQWEPTVPILNRPFIIPLLHFAGIAFMLPKLIHYIVDSLTGKLEKVDGLTFLLFMMFFPIFRLGPIERLQNFTTSVKHLVSDRISFFDLGYGLTRFLLGMVKIGLFSAVLLPWRQQHMAVATEISAAQTYLHVLLGVIEVYFHFGGYTDMAVGLSRVFGLRVMENFYLPMFSENIGEWWRRWHISLSFWLRDYVYMPLGGAKRHAMRNGLITFLLIGAWHDIASHYIIWGVLQAFGLAGLRIWKIFWYKVGRDDKREDVLKSLHNFMLAHPRLAWGLAVVTTYHYFALTGLYFILDTETATIAFVKVLSFGMF